MVRTEQKAAPPLMTARAENNSRLHPSRGNIGRHTDRPARSIQDIQTIVAQLNEKGAHLATTGQPADTSTATGKAFFDMSGVFAGFETNLPGSARPKVSPTQRHLANTGTASRRSTCTKYKPSWQPGQNPQKSQEKRAPQEEPSTKTKPS